MENLVRSRAPRRDFVEPAARFPDPDPFHGGRLEETGRSFSTFTMCPLPHAGQRVRSTPLRISAQNPNTIRLSKTLAQVRWPPRSGLVQTPPLSRGAGAPSRSEGWLAICISSVF